MKLFKKTLILFFLCLAFVSCSYSPGDYVPQTDFSLKDLDGKTVSLSDFKGKIVFIDFWASWCPPCVQSIPAVEGLYKQYADNPNVVFLGINVNEDKQKVIDFVKEKGITYKVLSGDREVMSKYKIKSIPSFFVIDKDGNIANKHIGFMPGIDVQWDKDIKFLLEK